jgi:hypothetical protein
MPEVNGFYGAYEISRIVEYLIHVIRADGCQPVILNFTPQWAPLKLTNVGETYLGIARYHRCPYFNFLSYLRSRYGLGADLIAEAYSDSNHPTGEVQREVAHLLADFMIKDAETDREMRFISASSPIYKVATPFAIDKEVEVIRKSNSLVEGEFYKFKSTGAARFQLGNCEFVRAFVINAAASQGAVLFSGRCNVVKDLSSGSEPTETELRVQVAPVFADLQGREGIVSVSLTSDQATEAHVSDPANERSWPQQLEIACLILESDPQPVHYSARSYQTEELSIIA